MRVSSDPRLRVSALKRAEFRADGQTSPHLTLVHRDGRRAVVPLYRASLRPGTLILREAGMRPADLGPFL